MLPELVIGAIAETAVGKGRDELLWPATSGKYLQPPAHLLRHTAASLAIHAGANPLVVQRGGQFVGTAGVISHLLDTENAATSAYAGRGAFVSVKKWFTGPIRQIDTIEPALESA